MTDREPTVTRQAAGNQVALAITAAAGERLAMAATGSFVELSAPLFEDVVAASDEATVVVPLLLSTGFHVRQDLPRMAARAGGSSSYPPAIAPKRQRI